MKPETLRYWRRIFVGNVIASAIVLFAFSGVTPGTPPRQIARAFGIAFVFSMIIGPLLGFAMPRIAPRIWTRMAFPVNWIAVSAAMTLLAIVGSAAAIAVLMAVGVVPASQFLDWFQGSFRVTIAVTLTIGLFITAYEVMRARVAQATAEAQRAALESRVQPHFLFNTLNSIAELIRENPAAAERMTGQLASLLRASLDHDTAPLVPLEDELRAVRDYLSIEQIRLGDRLRFAIHDDAERPARVPRLALQTLVENSIKYAVAARREGGTITIRATGRRAQPPHVNQTTSTVEDDGPGFDPSALPDGHGLALLRDRLALLFAGRVRLEVNSGPGRTSVAFTVPETHECFPGERTSGIGRHECTGTASRG